MISRTLVCAASPIFYSAAAIAQTLPMNGTFTIRYDRQTPQPIAPHHMKIDESGSGSNTSPGQPLDNEQVTVSDTVTLVNGRGPLKGTITFTTPNGVLTSAYYGTMVTDAQSRVGGQGRFRTVGASGAMAGTKGTGTFSTVFSSQTDMTTQWAGNFKVPAAPMAGR